MCRYAAGQLSSEQGGSVTPSGPVGNRRFGVEELSERSLGGKRMDLKIERRKRNHMMTDMVLSVI